MMPTEESTMRPDVTPEPIIDLVTGCMAAQYVMVGNEVGLFEHLGQDSVTVEDLAQRAEVPRQSMRILADGLAACGLIAKEDGRYRNGPETFTFLSGSTPADLRPYVRMAHRLGYPGWGQFEEVIRTGGGTGPAPFELAGEEQRILSAGIEAMTRPTAAVLAASYDFAGFDRIVDVAGGTGVHLKALVESYPDATGILFELPPVAAQARERLGSLIDEDRVEIVEGDMFEDPLPGRPDLVLLSNTLHCFTPERNRTLLRRLRDKASRGTRLLLVDFWTNADRTEPRLAALSAGEFYRLLGGDVYSAEEAQAWLTDTGWNVRRHQPLAGPASLIDADAA